MKPLAVLALVGVLVMCSATAGHAQGVALGVVGGVNLATLSVEDDEGLDFDSRLGIRAGAHLSVDLSPQFGFILEAVYSQKGAKTTEEGVDVGFNITYVEFPLLAKFMIPTSQTGKVGVHLAAGPTVGIEVSCKLKGEQGGTSVTFDCSELGANTKSVDFGVAALGGIDVQAGPGAVMFDVAYNLGLVDINDTADGGSIKNRNLYFQVGYMFPLGAN
jgi:hypothetical protein